MDTASLVVVLAANLALAVFSVVLHMRAVFKLTHYRDMVRAQREAAIGEPQAAALTSQLRLTERCRTWNVWVASISGAVAGMNVATAAALIARAV
jgi:hypothetical protein